jgi:catechol 2,3-dioxygenase-like lactoylglutathione lyase family enzyme
MRVDRTPGDARGCFVVGTSGLSEAAAFGKLSSGLGVRAKTNREVDAMGIDAVRVVSVPVSDQERALEFYVEKLGFELIRDDDSVPGIRWVQVAPRGASTALTLVTWFDSMPPGSLRGLVLGCEDLDGTYEHLVAGGVSVDRELAEQPWGKEAVIRDPDGNRLVLQQS